MTAVPIIISVAVSLAAGVLAGGCAGGGKTTQTLLTRNAQLANQVSTSQDVATGLAVVGIVLACGLGASLYRNIKGGKRGKADGE